MPVVRIDGPADPRVADYRNISEPNLVRVRGLFVAEGRLVVLRVIEDGRCAVRSVLISEVAHKALALTLGSLPSDVPVYVCDRVDFAGVTGFDIHQGCLALAERPAAIPVCELLRRAHTIVVLEGVTNADNVGGVFRSVAAFGADAVLLSPTCCDPLYRKAIRTSLAASVRVPFARIDDWPDGLADVRACGFTILALTPREPSETVDAFIQESRPARVALLVGTEGQGLSAPIEAFADRRVRIPIRRAVDSLNLAVATGIVLARLSDPAAL